MIASLGTQTDSTSFLLTVNPVNDAPTISSIPDQQTGFGRSTPPIPFLIQDMDSPGLTLSAVSSNPTLLPASNILFSGTTSNRAVRLTPAAGQSGQVSVHVTLSDGLLTASTTFTLTVSPSNAAPTISAITRQVTDYLTPLVSIPVIVGDAETSADNLTLSATSANPSLLPATNITFGGSGSNRTVTITPVEGRQGTVIISVGVHDGNSTARTLFAVTIRTPQRRLVITRSGAGSVTPDLNGKLLTVGQTYILKALPAPGQVFAGWGGGITSATEWLRFTMPSNLLLEARFVTNPYAPFKGTYTGLYHEVEEVRHECSGLVSLLTTSQGSYSGTLRCGSQSYPFSGRMDLACRATNTVERPGTNALVLDFELVAGPGGDQVIGRVTDGSWVAS
jgi:hypothetical protein